MLARGRRIDVAGRAVHVHDEGSGPAVLLLHGSGPGTTAATAWGPLAAALAGRHRVIAPDLAGFGASGAPAAGSRREAWVEQALGVLDALAVDSCAVVGNSAGGAIALWLAYARPRMISRVVAVGTMGLAMPLAPGLDRLWAFEPGRHAARELLELLFHDPAAVTPAAVEARLEAMLAQPHYTDLFPAPRERWVADLALSEAELAAITAPVLLVHGAEDRVVPPADSALALLALLGDVRAHVFGRCGHASPVERTDEFNRLLTTFLETDR